MGIRPQQQQKGSHPTQINVRGLPRVTGGSTGIVSMPQITNQQQPQPQPGVPSRNSGSGNTATGLGPGSGPSLSRPRPYPGLPTKLAMKGQMAKQPSQQVSVGGAPQQPHTTVSNVPGPNNDPSLAPGSYPGSENNHHVQQHSMHPLNNVGKFYKFLT